MIYRGINSKLSGKGWRWQRDNLALINRLELRKAKKESKGAEMAPDPPGTLPSVCDGFIKDTEARQDAS